MYRPYVQRAAARKHLPDDLQLKGVGWPTHAHFLMSEETQEPIGEVLHFLRFHYLSRVNVAHRKSPRSLEAAVYDFKDYVDFLDAHDLRLMDVRISHIENYVFSMVLNNSPVTGRPYARATIGRRVSTLRSFYHWAQESGLTKHRVDIQKLTSLDDEARRYHQRGDTVSKPKALRKSSKVRFIPTEALRAIMQAFGPLRVDVRDSGSAPTSRLRLMYECALQAGLRRFEIAELEVDELEKAERLARGKELLNKAPLEVLRKGGRYRTVMVPVWLVENLWHYCVTEREDAIKARLAIDRKFEDHGYLFVHDAASDSRVGDPLSPRYLSEPLRNVQLKLGINPGQTVERQPYQRLYGVHAFRHTYALMEYFSRKAEGDSEPWLYVQAQLGHSKLATTTDTYLEVAAEYEYEFGLLLSTGIRRVVDNG